MTDRRTRIIIADDNKTFLEGIEFMLSREKEYSVIDVCRNGKELVENPNLFLADIILTDIEMPVMNGIEAARKINDLFPSIPIVAITMHMERVFIEDLISSGFRGFIHKPEISKNLTEVLEKVLENKFVFPEEIK